jgi:hypothetical protein
VVGIIVPPILLSVRALSVVVMVVMVVRAVVRRRRHVFATVQRTLVCCPCKGKVISASFILLFVKEEAWYTVTHSANALLGSVIQNNIHPLNSRREQWSIGSLGNIQIHNIFTSIGRICDEKKHV